MLRLTLSGSDFSRFTEQSLNYQSFHAENHILKEPFSSGSINQVGIKDNMLIKMCFYLYVMVKVLRAECNLIFNTALIDDASCFEHFMVH